ncbi:IQ and ubiquitin-like domain-containing protein isoform X1 [Leucoraja erinacea]|uniref:IQ and ubiquitin-like domain-containing protein isoform X1 n=1 Tax=Leucoraja erinaceus TaxID=7782 RepID=UPI002456DC39|nr:IQ and ubiquitin-like domain-containing protein isoform X1 [Leucoraja erinacea]
MAENENPTQEPQDQGDAPEEENPTQAPQEQNGEPETVEDPSELPAPTGEVSEEGPSEEPADGIVDTSTTVHSATELPAVEDAEGSDHDEEGPTEEITAQEEVTADEPVETEKIVTPDHTEDAQPVDEAEGSDHDKEGPTEEATTQEEVTADEPVETEQIVTPDHTEVAQPEDSEIVSPDVGDGPTAEVTADETMGATDITPAEAIVPHHADAIGTKLILDCSKIPMGGGIIVLDCSKYTSTDEPTPDTSGPSTETPGGGTAVIDDSSIGVKEGATGLGSTGQTAPNTPDQSPEQTVGIEPSLSCEELKEKLEAQIHAIEEMHGKIEQAESEVQVSKKRAGECLILQTPGTAADRDLKKRLMLKSYSAKSKTPSPDFASSTATGKITLIPSCDVLTVTLPICITIRKLKSRFARQFKLPIKLLQITCKGRIIKDSETLVDLGVRPHGAIELELASTDPENYVIERSKPQQEVTTSCVITVKVQLDAKTCCTVDVEIVRHPYHKPYLGGYKHKITGTEFHHAGTQTPSKRTCVCVERFCRETQTVSEKNKYQQTTNNTSTQMNKIGCYVSNIKDKLLTPGRYFTAEEYHECRLNAVIVIQTYFRRWFAKNYVQQLRIQRDKRLQWEREQEMKLKTEKDDYTKRQYERRMNPKTREDFDLLFHALEEWKKEEVRNINQTLTGPERKAALYTLLEEEAKLIASIARHRVDAAKETGPKLIQNLLNKCADPIRWKAFDGRITEMDTQFTLRARELREIYNSINMKYLTTDERLDALLTLKHTVKEHDCKLTQEIMDLIDREADLLMRQVKEIYLDGLRQRISTLFLQYIKTPMFNPEIARFLKVPQDPMQLRKNIFFCSSCGSYIPSTDFPLSMTSRGLHLCRQCIKQNNEARHREESSQYKLIMKQLRKAEADFGDGSQLAFLVQEQDMKYLVDSIWGTQSALSANTSMKDLVMIRWDKTMEWSPWNCIILTEEEAEAHLKLDNIYKDYEATFIRTIKHRHTLGNSYFSRIPEIVKYARTCLMKDSTSTDDLIITNLLQAN